MRPIDADSLIEELQETFFGNRPRAVVYRTIELMPTIETKARKGTWLFYEEPDGYYHTECSECGQWFDEDVFLKEKWRYCPNCGCQMEGYEEYESD